MGTLIIYGIMAAVALAALGGAYYKAQTWCNSACVDATKERDVAQAANKATTERYENAVTANNACRQSFATMETTLASQNQSVADIALIGAAAAEAAKIALAGAIRTSADMKARDLTITRLVSIARGAPTQGDTLAQCKLADDIMSELAAERLRDAGTAEAPK